VKDVVSGGSYSTAVVPERTQRPLLSTHQFLGKQLLLIRDIRQGSGSGQRCRSQGVRNRRFLLIVQHMLPAIAQFGEKAGHLVDPVTRLGQVTVLNPSIEVIVKPA